MNKSFPSTSSTEHTTAIYQTANPEMHIASPSSRSENVVESTNNQHTSSDPLLPRANPGDGYGGTMKAILKAIMPCFFSSDEEVQQANSSRTDYGTMNTTNTSSICEVMTGESKIVTGNETLFTQGLSDCSAIILLHDRDPETGKYAERTMLHVNGSYWENTDAGALMEHLIDKYKAAGNNVENKLIIAGGTKIKSSYAIESVLKQSHNGRKLLLEFANELCPHETQVVIQRGRFQIKVTPKGEIERNEDDTDNEHNLTEDEIADRLGEAAE